MATTATDKTLGPVTERVAANVKELRYVSVRDLSAALEENGHTIWPSAITRLEQGTRRIDVDDLVALAAALGVSPNALLLPAEGDDDEFTLTGEVVVTRRRAWDWATGIAPLPDDDLDDDAVNEFQAVNQPQRAELTTTEMFGLAPKLAPVIQAITDAVENEGVSAEQVLEYLRLWGVSESMRTAPKPSKRPAKGTKKGGRR
jgi:transcriptional regulator with XRE-family HTH domain